MADAVTLADAVGLADTATLAGPVTISGIGLHTGEEVALTLRPASAGSGLAFLRTDLRAPRASRLIPADPAFVEKTQLGTVLKNAAGVTLSTVEHLLAALAMLGVTDALVEVDGPEIPILDGSAIDFIDAIEAVGLRELERVIDVVAPSGPVTVTHGDCILVAEPHPGGAQDEVHLDITIDFEHAAIGKQHLVVKGDRETLRKELASARTFTELRHVEALRAMGLARGGSLDNAIVLDEDGVMNPGGLRMADEFVRHKALDLVGDLYLLGMPLGCKITALRPGHTINTMMATALADERETETLPLAANA